MDWLGGSRTIVIMFTGLIQCIGKIASQRQSGKEAVIAIDSEFDSFQLGESIAINGACLSVTDFHGKQFSVFASRETLELAGVGSMSPGKNVNLEKALTLSTPLGGHLVTGHVDARVKVIQRTTETEAVRFRFTLPEQHELKHQIAAKGSIAIDGVSLTVNEVSDTYFETMIIPITLGHTTLSMIRQGDSVNLETDVIAKYIARKLDGEKNRTRTTDISMETLLTNGFMR